MPKITTNSELETKNIASLLAKTLSYSDVLLLSGPLGSGKTVFVKGIVKGLGGKETIVQSPTFTIIREYHFKKTSLYHIDFYRLSQFQEFIDIGYEEYCYYPDGITVIEWPEKIEKFLPRYIKIKIKVLTESSREIEILLKNYPQEKGKEIFHFFNKIMANGK